MENLPEKPNEEKDPEFGGLQDMAMMSAIEGILPIVQPFIGKAMGKLSEYFGNDDKIFVMKKIGGEVKVLVIDNTKGEYEISRVEKSDGVYQNTLNADPGVVIAIQGTSSFVETLLSGKFISETK